MARIQGLINPNISGKLGNAVFRVRKGQVLASAYQPIVHNPKTALQENQRERFRLASNIIQGLRKTTAEMYGTDEGMFERSSLMKLSLNSLAVKLLFRRFPVGKPTTGYITNADMRNKMSVINAGYTAEGLNIWDWGSTLREPLDIKPGTLQSCRVLVNGSDTYKDATTLINQSELFFGCDYILPEKITCNYITRTDDLSAEGSLYNPLVPNIDANFEQNFMEFNLYGINTELTGQKNRGFFSNAAACGSGWKYIYRIPSIDETNVYVLCPQTMAANVIAYSPNIQNFKVAYSTFVIMGTTNSSQAGITSIKGLNVSYFEKV